MTNIDIEKKNETLWIGLPNEDTQNLKYSQAARNRGLAKFCSQYCTEQKTPTDNITYCRV